MNPALLTKQTLSEKIAEDFSENGMLAKQLDRFNVRNEQKEMAIQIAETINNESMLIVEAGTGTGKTFAYLLPALRSGKKVVISTGSKALQDQLFHRDLPLILGAFRADISNKQSISEANKTLNDKLNTELNDKVNSEHFLTPVLLKGRSNYLCLERLEQQMFNQATESNQFNSNSRSTQTQQHTLSESMLNDLVEVRKFSQITKDGDITQCETVKEESFIWPLVTTTNDNCLGSDCPKYQNCFVNTVRKAALSAQLVVVNHHLFFADCRVKETGFGKLIPDADVIIFDEAHQIPDIATQYFGEQFASKPLIEIANDMILAYRLELREISQLQTSANYLINIVQDFRLQLGDSGFKGNLRQLLAQKNMAFFCSKLQDALDFAFDLCKSALGKSKVIDSCYERLATLIVNFKTLTDVQVTGKSFWYEVSKYHFVFAATPLSVVEPIQSLISTRKASWIFTSATLAVANNFDYFVDRMGLQAAKTAIFESPFDYAKQSLLCVPRYLLPSNHPNLAKDLADKLIPLILSNKGRCFFLCTSHAMLKALSVEFKSRISELLLLVQGEMSKGQLLQQFIESGNAVLLATSSFWEGVDVRGDALSCVIIDKLPFSSPDDPLLSAKLEDSKLRGNDPFLDVQIPEAVITLKQGVGRLIRDVNDFGVIVICDPRLVQKNYGKLFIESLPKMPRTRDLKKAEAFLLSKNF